MAGPIIKIQKNPNREMIAQRHKLAWLNMMLLSEVFLEMTDVLKNTPICKQTLKARLNMLLPEIEKVCGKDLAKIWGIDDETLYHLMNESDKLIKRLSIAQPTIWNMLNELLDMYEADPDGFIERNEIKIVEL